MSDTLYRCPLCDADLTGEPIPEKHRENFGGHTHFSRRLACTDPARDRVVSYQCPDCGGTWDREPSDV